MRGVKSKHLLSVAALLSFTYGLHAADEFSSMKEAKLVADYYSKFKADFSCCEKALDGFSRPKLDMTDVVMNAKRICDWQRWLKIPIPEEIRVSYYSTIEKGTSCMVDLIKEAIRGAEGRLRIDATSSINEGEKAILRKNLGKPFEEIQQRCNENLQKAGQLERAAARTAANYRNSQ